MIIIAIGYLSIFFYKRGHPENAMRQKLKKSENRNILIFMAETPTRAKIQTVLASNIKKLRLDRNLTQAALAKKAGTVGNYITLIENAARFPSAEMVERLASALEVESTDLFRPNADDFGSQSNPWNWKS